MINDDILIKFSLSHENGGFGNWVDYVRFLKDQIREIRDLDFSGIGQGDLDLIEAKQVKSGDRIILCDYLNKNCDVLTSDKASILGLVTRISSDDPMIIELEIEGLGHRPDLTRDPDRLLKWGEKIYPNLRMYQTLLRVTSKPKADGGSVYYFFNRSCRDSRDNWVLGYPALSRRAIIGSLYNISKEDLFGTRLRAQFMHFYRKSQEDILNYLSEVPGDEFIKALLDILGAYGKPGKNNIKKISTELWEKLKDVRSSMTGT